VAHTPFVKYHPRIGHFHAPDCTIFNYDTIYLLTDSGPVVYEHSMGGYIAPELGGRIHEIDWYFFIEEIKKLKPKIIIIPECYVNGHYPEIKSKIENEIRDEGYDENNIWVYLQKEENFYFGEINVEPDWFYTSEPVYKNIICHTIGHDVPKKDKKHYPRFNEIKFCKQGFMCESFFKLYALRNSTPEMQVEKRKNVNLKPGHFVFYGGQSTSNRPIVFEAIQNSKKLSYEIITYQNENLTELILDRKGIGLSLDGLVFNTIRDTEFGVNAVPSIKITRAPREVIDKNNINLWRSRYWKTIPRSLVPSTYQKNKVKKVLEIAYEEYMDSVYHNEKRALLNLRYQFFINILQKFYNIELFLFDILFGEDLEDFLQYFPLNPDFSIFKYAAKPEFVNSNNRNEMCVDYIQEILNIFDKRFEHKYKEFYLNINT